MTHDEILRVRQAAVEAEKRYKRRVEAATRIQKLWRRVRHTVAGKKLRRSNQIQTHLYNVTQQLRADTMKEIYNYAQPEQLVKNEAENPVQPIPKNKRKSSHYRGHESFSSAANTVSEILKQGKEKKTRQNELILA